MNHEPPVADAGDPAPDDAAHQSFRRAQIEQRLRQAFRLAGDGEAAQQLMQMVIEYRARQNQ